MSRFFVFKYRFVFIFVCLFCVFLSLHFCFYLAFIFLGLAISMGVFNIVNVFKGFDKNK